MRLLRNISDLLKTAKRGKPARIYCPKCGSPSISHTQNSYSWMMPNTYVCQDCGYNGPIVMELEKEEEKK